MELSTENIAAVTAAVIAAMSADSGTGVVVEAPESPAAKAGAKRQAAAVAKAGRARAKGAAQAKTPARKPAKVNTACITAGQAWTLLGANPTFEPKDHDKPANNGQLWALNTAGKLTLV